MKQILTLIFACAFLFSLASVSASGVGIIDLKLVPVEGIPTEAQHGQDTTLTFNLQNVGGVALNSLTWELGISGVATEKEKNTVSSIAIGTESSVTSEEVSVTLKIPENKKGSTTITLTATDSTGVSATTTHTIETPEDKKIELTNVQQITTTEPGKIKIKNTGNVALNKIEITSTGPAITFSSNSLEIEAGKEEEITLTLDSIAVLTGGENSIVITAKDESTDVEETLTQTFTVAGTLSITTLQEPTIHNTSGKIEVENTGDLTLDKVELTASGSNEETTFTQSSFSLAPGEKKEVEFTASNTNTEFGNNNLVITAKDATTEVSNTVTYAFAQTFCSNGEQGGNLSIVDLEISTTGDEEDEWLPFDEIDFEVEVKNIGNDDIKDVNVEFALFNSAGNDKSSKLTFDSSDSDEEKIDIGTLDEGDEETVTFKFTVPGDLDTGNYKLAVKVYSDKEKESNECSETSGEFDTDDSYFDIRVDREEDEGKFIVFDEVEFSPSPAICGDSVVLNANLFNIGDDNQERVRVNLFSSELNLDETLEIRKEIDEGEEERISINFRIPENLENKAYAVDLNADYDFKSGTYRESLDNPQRVLLNVVGCSVDQPIAPTSELIISADLTSDAQAGEKLTVTTTLRNPTNNEITTVFAVKGHETWATLDPTLDKIVNIAPGQSKDVVISFTVDEDASGAQSFTIETNEGNNKIKSQAVSLTIEKSGSLFGGLENNALLWVIGAVNLLLIIVIIVVAVRVAQR